MVTAGGGTCCSPSALRRMENTTENFTKEVDIISRNGSRDSRLSVSTVVRGFAAHETGAASSSRGSRGASRVAPGSPAAAACQQRHLPGRGGDEQPLPSKRTR